LVFFSVLVSSGLEDEWMLRTYFVQIRSQGRWGLWNGNVGWFGYMLYAHVSLFSVQWYSLIVLQLSCVNKIYGTLFHCYCLRVYSPSFLCNYKAVVITVSKFPNSCFYCSCKLKGAVIRIWIGRGGKIYC